MNGCSMLTRPHSRTRARTAPLWMLLVLIVCCGMVRPQHAAAHMVSRLSSWPVQHMRSLIQAPDASAGSSSISIRCNVSTLTASSQVAAVSIVDASPTSSISCSGRRVRSIPPRSSHLLALYAHPSDPATAVPLTFRNVSHESPGYLATGRATLRLKLINVRSAGLVLRLVAGPDVLARPLLLAESAVVGNAVRAAPQQVHLAQHADGRSVVVQWISGSAASQSVQFTLTPPAAAARSSNPPVLADPRTVASVSHTYTASQMCGEPAATFGFLPPGHMHVAVIPGDAVGHGRTLHYRVGSDAVGWSEPAAFTSAPSAADVAAGRAELRFLVFNDVGQENAVLFNDTCPPFCPGGWQFTPYTANSTKLPPHLLREQGVHLGLLVGDLAYANGYAVDWDFFGLQFEAEFRRWPLAVATGNHEADPTDSGGECNVPYAHRYYTPAWRQGRPDPATSFYSFNMAGVHIIMLDSERPTHAASPQGRFVAADLALVDRAATPWLVVGVHRQMAGPTTNPANVASAAQLVADFEEAFKAAGVDLVLQGHDHAYARTCPLYKGACVDSGAGQAWRRTAKSSSSSTASSGLSEVVDRVVDPGAPIYILAGHAGAGFTHAFPAPLPPWVVAGMQERNGYLRVSVRGGVLRVLSISSDDGRVLDGVEIVRQQQTQQRQQQQAQQERARPQVARRGRASLL